MNMRDILRGVFILCGLLLVFAMVACDGCDEACCADCPTRTPTPTSVPQPQIKASVVGHTDSPVIVQAKSRQTIQLDVENLGDDGQISTNQVGSTLDKRDTFTYDYTAPDVGGEDVVRFTASNGSISQDAVVEFHVLKLDLLGVPETIECALTDNCVVSIDGFSEGLSDDMSIVVLAQPVDAPSWSTTIVRTDGDGEWSVDVVVSDQPIVKSSQVNIVAKVLPQNVAIRLSQFDVDEPRNPLAQTNTVRLSAEPKLPIITLSSPQSTVPCDSTITCSFTADGTVENLSGDMSIVLFVNPLSTGMWQPRIVSDVDIDQQGNGGWQIADVKIQDQPLFAGSEFIVKSAVLDKSHAEELPSQLEEVPDTAFTESDPMRPTVVSNRLPLINAQIAGQLTIDSPPNFSTIRANEQKTVSGMVSGVRDGTEVWLLVYASNGKYFPQTPLECQLQTTDDFAVAIEAGDNSWSFPNLNIGSDQERQFDIVAILAEPDSEASAFFYDYFDSACFSGNFEGVTAEQLPSDISEKAFVTIFARP